MPTLRLARVVALAGLLAACGERAPAAPAPADPAASVAAKAAPAVGSGAETSTASQIAPAGGAAAPDTAPAPQGAPTTAAPPGNPLPPPAPPASVSTVLREAVALEPGGAALPLARAGDTVVDPGARFRVVLSIGSTDARMLLLDRNDALVAAEGSREVGQSTRLTLAPSAPLTPGRRYLLRVDGASTRELHDASGKAFAPATLEILVAGTPPPPEKKPAPKRRRR